MDLADELRRLPREEQRARLRETRGGGNWLGLIQTATLRARTADEARAEWARLAVSALETAREEGALEDREVRPREANLFRTLDDPAGAGLDADEVVAACLALAGLTPAEADAVEWAYRAEDVDKMRTLRRVRNVVQPAVAIAGFVGREELRRELEAWREVLPRLP
ncbi:hypothetical protein GCM10027445_39820 [Amycolatopsis endophytica]|uniref:Uncharacterized protein n=1 Tax=Amycolatopsis endophytica TaxID=860233 RepID=A0A853B0W4_9PSEU|nr:hypothetical protein [Amycolatopsis endophytica]NYI88346.1 hypothetical protein [Amycolatopsis endophytica]